MMNGLLARDDELDLEAVIIHALGQPDGTAQHQSALKKTACSDSRETLTYIG